MVEARGRKRSTVVDTRRMRTVPEPAVAALPIETVRDAGEPMSVLPPRSSPVRVRYSVLASSSSSTSCARSPFSNSRGPGIRSARPEDGARWFSAKAMWGALSGERRSFSRLGGSGRLPNWILDGSTMRGGVSVREEPDRERPRGSWSEWREEWEPPGEIPGE